MRDVSSFVKPTFKARCVLGILSYALFKGMKVAMRSWKTILRFDASMIHVGNYYSKVYRVGLLNVLVSFFFL